MNTKFVSRTLRRVRDQLGDKLDPCLNEDIKQVVTELEEYSKSYPLTDSSTHEKLLDVVDRIILAAGVLSKFLDLLG